MRWIMIAVALASLPRSATAAEPWFVSNECTRAVSLVYRARLDEVRSLIAELRRSSDPDARACAAWLPVEATEMEIALTGDEARLLPRLEKELADLEAFGEAHAGVGQRFADLILEAKLRRVYLRVRQGQRTEAIRGIEEGKRLLEARQRVRKTTPTYVYAEAIANLAITHAEWPVRIVLRLVGVSGDADRGKKAADLLLTKKSVYRPGATCVLRSFAAEKSDVLGPAVALSRKLHDEFPDNPVIAIDHAMDLHATNHCEEARDTLAPWMQQPPNDRIRSAIDGLLTSCGKQRAN